MADFPISFGYCAMSAMSALPSRMALQASGVASKPTILILFCSPADSTAARAPRAESSLIPKIASKSGLEAMRSWTARIALSLWPSPGTFWTISMFGYSFRASSNPRTRSWTDVTVGWSIMATLPLPPNCSAKKLPNSFPPW